MLTNKQKSYLKALANKKRAIYQIGKDGLSVNLLAGVDDYLAVHELIKVSLLKSCTESVNEVAIEISRMTKAEVVQIIGRTIILYRPSKEAIIRLP